MGWTPERPFSADYFGLARRVITRPPALYLGRADCRAEARGRGAGGRAGGLPFGLSAPTLAGPFHVSFAV